jgi:biotin operon repressor
MARINFRLPAMRRADRLFQITQYLRGRRLTTARQLAQWLSVSERTVYRDIRDLSLSGVPVDGEAGVGYRIKPGYDLPPLMFNADEIDALVIGMRMVQAWGGPQLGASAASALAKVVLACPRKSAISSRPHRCLHPPARMPAARASGWRRSARPSAAATSCCCTTPMPSSAPASAWCGHWRWLSSAAPGSGGMVRTA